MASALASRNAPTAVSKGREEGTAAQAARVLGKTDMSFTYDTRGKKCPCTQLYRTKSFNGATVIVVQNSPASTHTDLWGFARYELRRLDTGSFRCGK